MHNCPDCDVETKKRWLTKFADGSVEEVGLCPVCGRITVEGDEPIGRGQWINYDDTYPEGEFE